MGGIGRFEGFERPSRRARASERFILRVRVEAVVFEPVEKRFGRL